MPSTSSCRPLRLGAVALVLALSPAVHGQEPAGTVKVVSGPAFIVRQQKSIRAAVGTVVFESDLLRTGDDGRLGVTLRDDTRVSLGPMTDLRVSRIAYRPAQGQLALVLTVARGVIAYVSGQIARLSADSVRVETPDAVIGIRGTRVAIQVTDR